MIIAALLLLLTQSSEQAAEALKQGRFEEAARIYRQLVKAHPAEARLRMNLGLALHSGGKYAEAIREFQVFLKAYPQPGPVHLLMGAAHLKLRKPCDAVPALETARKWQSSPQVLIELGDAYFGCGRFQEAAKTFDSLGPLPKALQGSGLSYARLGRPDLAQAAFDRLASLPPTAELHELLAEVRTIEKRYDDAVTEMDAAAKLAPGDARIQRLRARALWRAGRYDDARALYSKLAPRWSHDPEFNYEFGDTLMRIEGAEAGLPMLEKAVRDAPQLLAARGVLGRALLQTGRPGESIAHLEAAARQDPALLLPLSRAYRATGRTDDAARAEAEYKTSIANQN